MSLSCDPSLSQFLGRKYLFLKNESGTVKHVLEDELVAMVQNRTKMEAYTNKVKAEFHNQTNDKKPCDNEWIEDFN